MSYHAIKLSADSWWLIMCNALYHQIQTNAVNESMNQSTTLFNHAKPHQLKVGFHEGACDLPNYE